jgi:hypothetical protein
METASWQPRIIRGRRIWKMDKDLCQHPEKLKGKPGQCSPEQIKECHGETGAHPGTENRKKK